MPKPPLSLMIEAVLFSTHEALTEAQLARITAAEQADVRAALKGLGDRLTGGIRLAHAQSAYRLVTAPESADVVRAFQQDSSRQDLSRPALETLAIVAYRGPAHPQPDRRNPWRIVGSNDPQPVSPGTHSLKRAAARKPVDRSCTPLVTLFWHISASRAPATCRRCRKVNMRINQFIASSTGLSRRAADAKIADGRVRVNSQIASLGMTVESTDKVTLDGAALSPRTGHTYVLLNKPEGYVSSRAKQADAPTLYELLPENFHTLRIAGRLDRDSSGLILLTDDGDFIQKLTHPSAEKTKRYELTLDHPLAETDAQKIASGIPLKDGISHVTLRSHKGASVVVTLAEGRNRQLRRTFGAVGYAVKRLHRTNLGPFEISELAAGAWTATSKTGERT